MKDQEGFPDLANFSARLRQARKLAGLNQTDFGALGGVGLGSQSRYEKAETQPAVGYIAGLAKHGIDVAHLLTGKHSADSLDPATSDLVTAVKALTDAQRASLLAFLKTMLPNAAGAE